MNKRTLSFILCCCSVAYLSGCGGEESVTSKCPDVCPDGQVCNESTGFECIDDVVTSTCPTCKEGQHCDASTGYKCVDDATACPKCKDDEHCDASTDYKCVPNSSKSCPETCDTGNHCDESTGFECVPDEKTCPTCEEGYYCNESTGFKCVEAPKDKECPICEEGYYCDETTGFVCALDETPSCPQCGENEICNESTGQCELEQHSACAEECAPGYSCNEETGKCEKDKECNEAGVKACSGDLLMQCNAEGMYDLVTDCTETGLSCFADKDGIPDCRESKCTPSSSTCDGNVIQNCNAYHEFVAGDDCTQTPETPVCEVAGNEATCVAACPLNETKCEGQKVLKCGEDGKFAEIAECDGVQNTCLVNPDTNVASCVNFECTGTAFKCVETQLKKCDNGWWVDDTDCSAIGSVCLETGTNQASCIEQKCNNGDKKCEGYKLMECQTYSWVQLESCLDKNAFCMVGKNGAACEVPQELEDDTDTDKDGIPDYLECANDPDEKKNCEDTDKDGTPDYLDLDSDGDGIPDKIEANNSDGMYEPDDADYDDIPNYRDPDSDGNGVDDSVECCGGNTACLNAKENGLFTTCIDTDKNGMYDFLDFDNDGDGASDVDEIKGLVINPPTPESDKFSGYGCKNGNAFGTASKPVDCDGDKTPDYMDTDSDNDGLSDKDEGLLRMTILVNGVKRGSYARYNKDTDSDGINDKTEWRDSDGDGIKDLLEVDSDDDGLSDYFETYCCTTANQSSSYCKSIKNWCSSATKADTDSDGDSDLIEYGAETDPNDKNSNHLQKGNFVFTAPYNQATTPNKESLALQLSIQMIDIFFNIDQSSSTKDEAKKLNEKLPSILAMLQCEDLNKACIENSECTGLKNKAGQSVDAICSEKGRCIVNPTSGDGCFDDMELGLGYYSYIDSFWVAVALGEEQDTSKGTLSNVDTVVTALKRYYPAGNYEVAFQGPICAAEGISDNCTITNTKWKQTYTCKPASDACKAHSYDYITGNGDNSVKGCSSACKRNCVDLAANPDREACVGYRKSAIHIYAQIFDEEQCRYNGDSYHSRCVGFFENIGTILKKYKMRWMGLQSSSSSAYCTVAPKTSSTDSSVKCIDGLCEEVCTSSNKLKMSAVSNYIGKASGSLSTANKPFTYAATGENIDTQFTSGVREIAKSMPMNITATVEDLDSSNKNASKLVQALNVHLSGGTAQGKNCFKVPAGKIVSGTYQGISQIAPIDITNGYSVCYDVIPVQKQKIFQATSVPQVKKARVKIIGDGSVLNSGIAYFLIPPAINDTGEISD